MVAEVPNPPITFLLAIELETIPNGNPTNDFIGGKSLAFLMLCNVTPPVGLLFNTVQIYIVQLENLNNHTCWNMSIAEAMLLACLDLLS